MKIYHISILSEIIFGDWSALTYIELVFAYRDSVCKYYIF